MRAVVVALGKIGLPLAVQMTRAGHHVVGCDIDTAVVDAVNAGRAPFPNEAGLDEALRDAVAAGTLRAQTDTRAAVAERPDLVVAVPPLYVDDAYEPTWGSVDAVARAVGEGLQSGTTVCFETTLPVGTTRERIAPALESFSGLRAEQDFHVAFSPERVSSGRVFEDLATYPKLVGGLSAEGEARAVDLYASFLSAEVWSMGSAEAAEMAKLVETTYRDVNIALANEFAQGADRAGVDIRRIIDAANSQPYSHVHDPGIAVGGHCIPVYPHFYLRGHSDARLPAAARGVNEAMPAYALDQLGDVAGRRVLVLGVAYRGGVKETAFSGARTLRSELTSRGATGLFADPLYSDDELTELGFPPWDGADVDAVVVQTDHPEYRALGPADLGGARVVVDGRGILDARALHASGIEVHRIGRPVST